MQHPHRELKRRHGKDDATCRRTTYGGGVLATVGVPLELGEPGTEVVPHGRSALASHRDVQAKCRVEDSIEATKLQWPETAVRASGAVGLLFANAVVRT